MPDWSPVAKFGGYGAPYYQRIAAPDIQRHHATCGVLHKPRASTGLSQLWGSGCDCFAF
jgi:hypothetical protein